MGGTATQESLKEFNPLFCLNYSATHKQHHELVYVLDALDAYNKRLVKRIEVKGFDIKNLRGTDSYLFLEGIVISRRNRRWRASSLKSDTISPSTARQGSWAWTMTFSHSPKI